ncbi:hypothetical protein [Streptomyces sp. NPDC094144]|uniref:DUF7848 domain-containing protein n=1 Tax=Streptomyces sp. NPDC094144 TaxID=3366056 RepID=UPI003821DD13
MTRALYRYANHTLRPDVAEDADPVLFVMECKACEERSEGSEDPADGSRWAVPHLKENEGHEEYREIITRHYRFTPDPIA